MLPLIVQDMIVDSHVHVWSSDSAAYPWQPLLAHVQPPTTPAPIERLLADMDGAGVARAILVQPSAYGPDHRYLERCLKASPGRFAGICQIDPRSLTPGDDLARLCADGLYRGLRLNTIRQQGMARLASRECESLFETIEKFGLSLSFHMDIDQAPLVAQLADRYPAIPFIIDYLGPGIHQRPDVECFLDRLAAKPNIHFKLLCTAEDSLKPYPFADITVFYGKVLTRFGASRVMFGSDYPGAARICAYDRLIAWGVAFPGLAGPDRTLVMGGTAAKLFALV